MTTASQTPRTSQAARAEAAALLVAVAAFHVVDHRLVPGRWHLWTHLAATGAALAAARRLGMDADELGMGSAAVPAGLVVGGASAAVTLVGVGAAAAVPAAGPVFDDERVRGASGPALARWTLVEIPLGTALYEEVVFRGIALGLARRHLDDPAAVALTSAGFGAWHILPAIADQQANPATAARHPLVAVAGTVAVTTVAGAWLASLRLRSGSLVAPVLAHTASNAVPVLVARLVQRRRGRGASAPDGSASAGDRQPPLP